MYIILEFQSLAGSTAIVPPVVKSDINKAYQEFYTHCAAAAVSAVEMHTVMLVYANGNVIESKTFNHGGEGE